MDQKTTIYVCTGCGKKKKDSSKASKGNGESLLEKLQYAFNDDPFVEVMPTPCLSNCDRGISVALTAHGKYHWLFGEKSDACDNDIMALIKAGKAYQTLADGFLEKPDRPQPVIARIPPVK